MKIESNGNSSNHSEVSDPLMDLCCILPARRPVAHETQSACWNKKYYKMGHSMLGFDNTLFPSLPSPPATLPFVLGFAHVYLDFDILLSYVSALFFRLSSPRRRTRSQQAALSIERQHIMAMRKAAAFAILFLPFACCRPGYGNPFGFGFNAPAPEPKTKYHCSANPDNAILDWARDPGWNSTMWGCLEKMNNDGWNGAECVPASADGTQLGPTFGFWKGEAHWEGTGTECYNMCSDCLKSGINALQAVTTTCEYEKWTGLLNRKQHCDVGFTYGT